MSQQESFDDSNGHEDSGSYPRVPVERLSLNPAIKQTFSSNDAQRRMNFSSSGARMAMEPPQII